MKTVLAIDVGYGNTKAVWNRRDINGKIVWDEICFPSVATQVTQRLEIEGMANPDRIMVDVEGRLFYVGPEVTAGAEMLVGGVDYISKPEYEALICGAWSYMMKSMGRVVPTVDVLVLGLPVANFVVRRGELSDVGNRIHKVPVPVSLKHGIAQISAKASQVYVIPQPYGSMRLAHEIALNDDLASDGFTALVIDPGYGTLDWFVAKGLMPQMEMSSSFEGGVKMILKEVSFKVGKDHGAGSPNMSLVAKGLQNGFMLDGGKRIDMTKYALDVDLAANTLTSQFLQRFDPRKEGVNRIILAGGGAKYFARPLTESLPEYTIETMDMSVMSNARGFWLHGWDNLQT
jgi:plasmid segregation protein ParM